MTEFKTLQDLTYVKMGRIREDTDTTNFYDTIQIDEFNDYCYPGQLKKEAIKWIKDNQKTWDDHGIYFEGNFADGYEQGTFNGRKDIMMRFFNITEEDLK